MKTYYIKIEETRSQIVEVHADSLVEAVDKAENVYYDGTLELQTEDVDETFFNDVTQKIRLSLMTMVECLNSMKFNKEITK